MNSAWKKAGFIRRFLGFRLPSANKAVIARSANARSTSEKISDASSSSGRASCIVKFTRRFMGGNSARALYRIFGRFAALCPLRYSRKG